LTFSATKMIFHWLSLQRSVYWKKRYHALIPSSSSLWKANGYSASQKVPHIYGTQMFIIVIWEFTGACHWSLPWDKWIQSTLPHLTFKIYSNILIPSTPRSFKKSLLYRFSTKILCIFFISSSIYVFPSVWETRLCYHALQLETQ
jgi:hypothetical protein